MKDDGTFELGELLSEDDHGHLRARWDVTGLRRNAENMGIDPMVANGAEFWDYETYKSQVDAAKDQEPEAPAENPPAAPGGSADPIGGSVGERQATGLTEPVPVAPGSQPLGSQGTAGVEANDNGVRAFADPELADRPYDSWTNDQLRAEIAKRNELRDGDPEYADEEPLSEGGNKPDLVARLTDDDEADAPDTEEGDGSGQ